MDKEFFCTWLKGFEKGLDEMTSESRSRLLRHCAKQCADTGVLQAYQKLHQDVNGNRDTFYSRLSELGNVCGEIIVPDKEYRICFPECACDLYCTGGIRSPHLCECSRQSILYVAESIWTGCKLHVEQDGTILSGDKECQFRILFD